MAREQAFLAQPFASPSPRIIASPFQFATDENTNLRIVSANSLSGVVLAIHGRRLNAKGEIEPFAFTHTPNTDRTTRTQDYKVGAGALLNLVIFASSGSPLIGQTYVMAHLILGFTGATIVLGQLLGGYVTAAQPLAYPGSPIESSIAGGGYVRTITGTDPAVGDDISEAAPTGARWQLLAASFDFTGTTASSGRSVGIGVTASGVKKWQAHAHTTQGGTGLASYYCAVGAWDVSTLTDLTRVIAIPEDAPMLGGETFFTVRNNGLADDDFGAPLLTVREWLEVSS